MRLQSYDLRVVLAEAIQDHANLCRRGEPSRTEVMAALWDIAASYAAEQPDPIEREQMQGTFCVGFLTACQQRAASSTHPWDDHDYSVPD